MLSKLVSQLSLVVWKLERNIYFVLRGEFSLSNDYNEHSSRPLDNYSLDSFQISPLTTPCFDSVLWAVPKKRRSLEKRLSRKFGWPSQVWKPLVSKKNLLICKTCGDYFEAGFLCPKCYAKVKEETQEIQKTIENKIGLKPIDKEVVIQFSKDGNRYTDADIKGKQIIEITKERPCWFSRNLLQKTSNGPSTASNIKPSDLA